MPKVIEVRFKAQQGAEDLFIGTGFPKKVYIRQPAQDKTQVVWTTASKCGNGYKADTPLKADVSVRVISGTKKDKKTLFEEVMRGTDAASPVFAEKKELFSCELLAQAAKDYVKQLSLQTYERWSQWLLRETRRHNYTGYQDNWLHFGTNCTHTEVFEKLDVMGVYYNVEESTWNHMVCSNTWKVVQIKDPNGNVVELCGYDFD